METSSADATNSETSSSSSPSNGGASSRTLQLASLRFLQSPVSSLLEYAGILRVRPDYPYSEAHPLVPENMNAGGRLRNPSSSESVDRSDGSDNGTGSGNSIREVSIRIVGEQARAGGVSNGEDDGGLGAEASRVEADDDNGDVRGTSGDNNNREASPYQRYDMQQVARWIEQILPFSLLLLVVFVRQHLQVTGIKDYLRMMVKSFSAYPIGYAYSLYFEQSGFVVAIYITAILFKSNDILRKQTALKGERKISVLVGYSVLFMLHVFVIYWWHRKDGFFFSLLMIPPKAIPPFWHAIFIILVNDTMVRQAAMILKLVVLMYYKNGRGHNFRRQGQMLTLVEYTLLLYRALLPAPVWYRFFLNKEYGSLFSSLTTGLYLTFKLTSIVEKVQSFFAAVKGLSRKEIHYGSHATTEQVNAAGDLCAICQEKMHAPILLRCKHIFCEDCVSEWFERERTCPLCRALVRPPDLRSGGLSTTLFFQMF
ncbi:UNVERIFIED_CONTAM: RING finger and transmembrane domain-containing protein 2 [Sesamum radiatum]|uniref:RING finger and transmembrane domain-containing protein 2 n=1 Tax=Sesamum radiatum TaxID=300843 RepID=A0AAW2TF03_SESRA